MRTRMQSPGCVRVCVGVVSTRAIAEPASLSTSLCVPSLYTALLYPNRKDLERGSQNWFALSQSVKLRALRRDEAVSRALVIQYR